MRLDPDDLDTLQSQLAWLVKRDGFVPRRLAQAGIVDELLRGSKNDSFERLRHRFISAIHSLPNEDAELLLDAFALTPDTETLTVLSERRKVHGRKIHKEVDTVRIREQAALKQLHSRLVNGHYAQSPLVLDVPEMHGGIIYEATDTLITVENRRWRSTIEHYRFANMAGDLDYVTVSRSYPALVGTRAGSDFKVNSRPVDGGGWNDHFWHLNAARTATEPMRDKTIYDLFFQLQPQSDADTISAITLGSRAFHHRSLLATIRVRFQGEHPASIWKFEHVSPFARPNTTNEYNEVTLEDRGTCTMILRDVHGGLFSGFGWNWTP